MKKNYSLLIIFSLLFSLSYSQISNLPHSTSFESASDLGSSDSDANSKWSTSASFSGAELAFTRYTGAPPTRANYGVITGPTAASDGDYYVYVESSGSTSGDDAFLTAKYNLSGYTDTEISFKYHNAGAESHQHCNTSQ